MPPPRTPRHRPPHRSLAAALSTILVIQAASCGGGRSMDAVEQAEGKVSPGKPHDFTDLHVGKLIEPSTARESLPGSGQIGPDGAYRFSMPLVVPPGRGEVTPSLSLEYSSQAGNGAVGVGWNLGGLSKIHPCDAIAARDNVAAEGDKLCLDGRRLIEMATANEFRTEEDIVAKIVRLPSDPTFAWKVYLKDHRIRFYRKPTGGSNESPLGEEQDRSENIARYTYKSTSPPLIDSIRYTFHSSGAAAQREIKFSYVDRADKIARRVNGESYRWDVRLDGIEMHAPNPDTTSMVWKYGLDYDLSPDTDYSRLKAVRRCAPGGGCSYWKQFGYTTGGPRFQDKQRYPADSIDVASPILVLDLEGDGMDDIFYGDTRGRFKIAFGGRTLPLGIGKQVSIGNDIFHMFPVDIDGDGATEMVMATASFDADAWADAETYDDVKALFHYEVWRWNTSIRDFEKVPGVLPASAATPSFDAFFDPQCNFTADALQCEPFLFVDVNGDSLPDLVKTADDDHDRRTSHYHPTRWEIYLNTGGAFAAPLTMATGLASDEVISHSRAYHSVTVDGRQHVRFGKTRWLDIDSTTTDMFVVGLDPAGSPVAFAFGDDPPPSDSGRSWPLELDADGDGVRDLRWLTPPHTWATDRYKPMRADVDGDGRDDVVSYDNDTNQIYLHVSKTLASSTVPMFSMGQTLTHDHDLAKVAVGDFDGDGRPDVVGIEAGAGGAIVAWKNVDEWHRAATSTEHVDLLHWVSDEGAARETVWYGNDRPVFGVNEGNGGGEDLPAIPTTCTGTPADYGAHAVPPTICSRRGFTVAYQHQRSVPLDGTTSKTRTVRYSYYYPFHDAKGRGFLGFRMIRAWDAEAATETETYYANDLRDGTVYPQAFRPSKILTATAILDMDAGGGTARPTTAKARILQVENTWQKRSLNGGRTYAVDHEKTSSFEWEEDVDLDWDPASSGTWNNISKIDASPKQAPRQHTVDPTYDDFGNLTAQTATTKNGVRSELTMQPKAANLSSWLVDLPENYKFRSYTPSLHAAPSWRHVRFGHDTVGRLTTEWIEPTLTTSDDLRQTIEYLRDAAYGSYGQVTGILRTAPGAGTRFVGVDLHDATGEQIFPARAWNGLGHTTTQLFHPAYGLLVAEADPNDVVTTQSYDDLGRPRRTETAGGDAVELTYEESGHNLEVTTTTASGGQQMVTYDDLRRPVADQVIGFDGRPKQTSRSYDLLGRPWQSSTWGAGAAGTKQVVHRYDTLGRPRFVDLPDGQQLESQYVGMFETVNFDAKDAKKRQLRDVDGRVTDLYELVDGVEQHARIQYKPFDLVGFTWDHDNNQTELTYDHLGRAETTVDANTGTTKLFHNGFGEVRRVERGAAGGTVFTTYLRDDLGRVTTMTTSDGTNRFFWDAIDGVGKLDHEVSYDGSAVSYRYDGNARVSGTTWTTATGIGFDLDVTRDGHGRVTQTQYPSIDGKRVVVEHGYAGGYLETLTDVSDPATPAPLWTITERAPDGALQAGEFGDSVGFYQAAFDDMGRPTRVQAYQTPSTMPYLLDVEYQPDANGNVERREDHATGRVETFSYDELHRLRLWNNKVGSTTVARDYRYDAIGNLEKVYDGASMIEEFVDRGAAGPQKLDHSTGGVTYDYDPLGRQTRAGSRTIEYNAFDLPRRLLVGGSGATFQYTASGDRIRRADTTGILETIYVDRLYERHKVGGGFRHVHHVVGPDGPVADIVIEPAGRRVSYLATDALGSISTRFDGGGAVRERLSFDPFGKRINADGSAWSSPWLETMIGFAGMEHDYMAMVNAGGRMYDPAQRRFVSPDPLVSDPLFTQAWHRYSYARNNPATITDPTGWWIPPAWLCGYAGEPMFLGGSEGGRSADSFGPPAELQALLLKPATANTSFESYQAAAPGPATSFTGTGYAGGDRFARFLIDTGVDAWLQENGDAAINVSLGISAGALTVATLGMAAEAGAFVGVGARIASFGARSWQTITGAAGAMGEGVRRYGDQLTRWGAQVMRDTMYLTLQVAGVGGGGPVGGAAAAPSTLARVISVTARLDQKGFTKHNIFGLVGNWSQSRAGDFTRAVNAFINDPAVVEFAGRYRDVAATFYYHPATGQTVVVGTGNVYITALEAGALPGGVQQLEHLLLRSMLW